MKIGFLVSVYLCVTVLTVANAETTSKSEHTEKKRSIQLVPQWSLPFQGQLSNDDLSASSAPKTDAKAPAKQISAVPEAVVPLNDGLSSVKQKNFAVLTVAPSIVQSGPLIASAQGNDIGLAQNDVSLPLKDGPLITGGVSEWDGPSDVDHIVNHLVDKHFENSPEGQKLDKQVKRLSDFKHKTIAATKDTMNQFIEYQGIEPSMRAGRLVIDSHDYKVRNNAWAEYERQKYIDQIHFQVVSSLMEIAEGIGNSETERGIKSIAAGKEALKALVGEEESSRTVSVLTHWLNNLPVSYSNFAQVPWTTMERTTKLEEVLKAAVEKDEVITKITQRVYKYAHPTKTFQYSSNVIQTTLDAIALFAPGIIPSVSAGAAEALFKLGTGGTELNKLERELLLDKRIQSRLKVLTEESSLALDSYRYALITKNPPLLAFSDEVIGNLTGRPSTKVVSAETSFNGNVLIPQMKENAQDKDKHRIIKIPLVN